MTDFVALIFATLHPNWADIKNLLNSLLTGAEQRPVLYKANEELQRLHQENPYGALGLPRAILLTKPNQDPNGDGLPLLEHYKR